MNQRLNTVELTRMALLTTLICVPACIVIPLPFTPANLIAQTLVVNPIALLLAPGQAAFTMVVYILPGLTSLSIFSGAMGGPGKLLSPTRGYTMSRTPAVILMSRLKGTYYSFKRYCLATILVGVPVIYLVGSAHMKFIAEMDWVATFTIVIVPLIPLDIFKCFAATLIAEPVQIGLSDAQRTR